MKGFELSIPSVIMTTISPALSKKKEAYLAKRETPRKKKRENVHLQDRPIPLNPHS
jgi:hypothetical protein